MNVVLGACLALYAAASVSYALAALWKRRFFQKYSWWIFAGGAAFHAAFIGMRAAEARRLPLIGTFETVFFFGFIVTAVYLAMEKKSGIRSLGLLAAPLVFAGSLFAALQPREAAQLDPALRSPMFPVHASVFFISYAFFALSFLAAMAYLVQEWLLKKKMVVKTHRLFPPLETIDTLCYRLVSLGFPLITLGMITGAVWAHSAWGRFWDWSDPKLTFSLITWLVYAVYLHLRFMGGWQGRRTNIFLILGFLFLLFTFYGVSLLPGGKHVFGPGQGG